MTIPNEDSASGPYFANGATKVFPYNFKVVGSDELSVLRITGEETEEWVDPAEYTVNDVGATSGSVTFNTPPASGAEIWIVLDPAFIQTTRLESQGPYLAAEVENRLDRIVNQSKALKRDSSRAVKVELGGSPLTVSDRIADGETLMKQGNRLVPGPDAADIADARQHAKIAVEHAVIATEKALEAAQSAAQLSNYLASPIKLSSYVNADGTNEDAGFAAFLAELQRGGKSYDGLIDVEVRLGRSHTLAGYSGGLGSAGEGALVFTGGTDGLIIDNSGLSGAVLSTLRIYGVPIRTTGVNVGTALRIIGSEPGGDELVPQLHMMFPRAEGVTTATGWLIGFALEMIKSSKIEFPVFRGCVPPLESNGFCDLDNSALHAMYIHNGCNEVEISYPRFDWGRYGIYVGREPGDQMCEGIVMRGGMVRAMRAGYVSDLDAGEQFQSLGVHYDTTAIGVLFGRDFSISTNFSFVSGNFFLRSRAEGYAGAYAMIATNCNYQQIYNNTGRVAGDEGLAGRYSWSDSSGIRIGSDSDPNKVSRGRLDGNILNGFGLCIHLLNSAENMRGQNTCNREGNVGQVELLDTGAGNLVQYKANAVCEGYLAAAALNVTGDGTEVTIAGLTVTLNENGGLVAGGVFTAPVAGHYLVEVNVGYAESGTASAAGEIRIYANGVRTIYAVNPVTGYGSAVAGFYLEKGQAVAASTIVRGMAKTVDLVGGGANGTRMRVTLLRAR